MTRLAVITLTTPAMFLGMAGLVLPIAAHMLRRRAARKIVFPTIQFLSASFAGQAKIRRIQRWIMLMLRCLAMALIVAAFAQPIWSNPGAPPPVQGQGVGVVLVLDNSASSGQLNHGAVLIESLRSDAQRVLGELNAGVDSANVVFAAPKAHAAFERLSKNMGVIAEEINEMRPAPARADLPGAIALAVEQLRAHAGPRRIVVLSDMQAANWTQTLRAEELVPADVSLTILPAGSGSPGNVALSHPRPLLESTPMLGRGFLLAVTLSNFSSEPARPRLEFWVDDKPFSSRSVDMKADEIHEEMFEATFLTSGPHAIRFSISDDALAADNTAWLSVDSVGRTRVLVISDEDPNRPGTGAYFLVRAVAPREGSGIGVQHLHSNQVTPAALEGVQEVMVDHVSGFTPSLIAMLAGFVERGGGLMLFYDPQIQPRGIQSFDESLRKRKAGFLPAIPVVLRRDTEPAQIGDDGATPSPVLRDFDERGRAALQQVRFDQVWTLKTAEQSNQSSILTYSDHTPALFLRDNIAVANFSPSSDAGDLGKYGVFVALMQSMIENLQTRHAPLPPQLVGENLAIPVSTPLATGTQVTLLGPDGLRQAVRVENVSKQGVTLPVTADILGFYRLLQDEQTLGIVGVNLDPRESDLRRIDAGMINNVIHPQNNNAEIRSINARDTDTLHLRGTPLWPFLVVAAMAALGLELLLLTLWKR